MKSWHMQENDAAGVIILNKRIQAQKHKCLLHNESGFKIYIYIYMWIF